MEITYAEACVLAGAQVAYAAAREVALDEAQAAIGEWGEGQVLTDRDIGGDVVLDEVVEDAQGCVAVYSNGDVPQAPEGWEPDFDMGPVRALAEHVDDEGSYEGHRTGVCAVAARAEELAEQISEYGQGDNGESPAYQARVAELAEWLSARYGIPTDAPPRFNHPAGVA